MFKHNAEGFLNVPITGDLRTSFQIILYQPLDLAFRDVRYALKQTDPSKLNSNLQNYSFTGKTKFSWLKNTYGVEFVVLLNKLNDLEYTHVWLIVSGISGFGNKPQTGTIIKPFLNQISKISKYEIAKQPVLEMISDIKISELIQSCPNFITNIKSPFGTLPKGFEPIEIIQEKFENDNFLFSKDKPAEELNKQAIALRDDRDTHDNILDVLTGKKTVKLYGDIKNESDVEQDIYKAVDSFTNVVKSTNTSLYLNKENSSLSYDELLSDGWIIEKQELNFSLLSKNNSELGKNFKFFESQKLAWEKSFSTVITISNITSTGLISIVWENFSNNIVHKTVSDNSELNIKSMLSIIDKFGQLKTNITIMASPTTAILHDTFFACIFPYPRNNLRCYSLIQSKWKLWNENIRKYGNSTLSIVDDLIILSKQNDGSIIFKVNIDGVFQKN